MIQRLAALMVGGMLSASLSTTTPIARPSFGRSWLFIHWLRTLHIASQQPRRPTRRSLAQYQQTRMRNPFRGWAHPTSNQDTNEQSRMNTIVTDQGFQPDTQAPVFIPYENGMNLAHQTDIALDLPNTTDLHELESIPVSYTHLTLPTILLV